MSEQGLKVWDSNGVLTLDTTSQTTKIIGVAGRGTTRFYNNLFSNNTPFYIISPTAVNEISKKISVEFSGNRCTVINNTSDIEDYEVIVGAY